MNIFKGDAPTGPFEYIIQLSPDGEESIDGTLHFDQDGSTCLVYSHTLQDVPEGDMCAVKLAEDWLTRDGERLRLFSAGTADWTTTVPFAKAEFESMGTRIFPTGQTSTKCQMEHS